MILTCPACSARYVVDPKALMPSGRMVRCAKCKHSWKEAAPDIEVTVVDETEAESPAVQDVIPEQNETEVASPDTDIPEDEFAIKRSRRKKRPRPLPKGSNLPALQNHKHGSILWGWYGLGAFVALFITSFLIFQTTISEFWPPSQKLYRSLGLENKDAGHGGYAKEISSPGIPPEEQFKIEDTTPRKFMKGKVVTLKIQGNIANLTDQTLTLPLLRISLKDGQGKVIREWTFKSSEATISKGEKVPFSTSLPNPPEDAASISVTFDQK